MEQKITLATTLIMAFTCTLLTACTSGKQEQSSKLEDGEPVAIRRSLFYNPDSLRYYSALAYKDDDPKGLFVTGMTYYLRQDDPDFLPGYPTPSKEEADIMLLHAADLGYSEAIQFIHCLWNNNQWDKLLPESR